MKEQILQKLQKDPVIRALRQEKGPVCLLDETREALAWASVFLSDRQTRIIVKKDAYSAQQLYNRLVNLVDEVLLFVMEESLRVISIAGSPEDKEEMIHSLSSVVEDDKPRLIICNTAGLCRYLPDPNYFKEMCISLETDEECDMNALKERLNRMGYARLNYVDRPCTFATRGGIIDIFTLEYEHPIRIEFFDTVIESIRFFDEESQRTIEQIDRVNISCAGDLLFHDEQIREIRENVQKELKKTKEKLNNKEDVQTLQDRIESDLMSLESYEQENTLYFYYPYTKTYSLTDYIQAPIIFSSEEEIFQSFKKINQDAIGYMQERVNDHLSLPKYTMFTDINEIQKRNHCISLSEFEHGCITGFVQGLERATRSLPEQLEDLKGYKQLYFSLDKTQKESVEACLKENDLDYPHTFIEPDFYEGFEFDSFAVVTSRELFIHAHRPRQYQKTFKEGRILENVMELEKNDYVVHETYGIGQYAGIVTRSQNGKNLDYLHILYRGGDELYVPLSQFQLVRKYVSKEGTGIKLSKLGSSTWKKTKEQVSQKVEEIAARLVDLYALRSENIGYAYPEDDALQREFEEAFEYESTPDQLKACEEIKREMEKPRPMDHLLCGDVGFGKTEVAMRCAFKAIRAGKQVAFLCPTTILSMQHYQTVSDRFADTGANVALVNRFVSQKEITGIIKGLKDGTIDIVIGTHRLLNSDFKYKDLGFLIIDEEQRFGVEHKEKIKEMKNSIDVLALSATPIPRTMQMSLIGVRTISQLNTPPAKRHPVMTYIIEKRGTVIEEVIARELARGGQVFYLYNRIDQIYTTANHLANVFKDVKVAVAHGRMEKETIEETMLAFARNEYQILVCTTIIETGLDIANANTILIEDADRFGLSQLYQIRGRVGRREKLAYCYLMVPPDKELTPEASKRLRSIKEFTRLGSGYKIAMRDLTIRGAGDLLGPQQAGFIDQVGLDMYLDMLSQALKRQKGEKIEKEKERKAQISFSGHIPVQFTENDGDKLSLYQEVEKIQSLPELMEYQNRIRDLFGKIPKEVNQIFEQRRYDLFANLKGVSALKEEDKVIRIVLDEKFSSGCNGIALFEEMNRISRSIQLTLKNKKIQIMIPKKNKNKLLVKTLDTLQEKFLCA